MESLSEQERYAHGNLSRVRIERDRHHILHEHKVWNSRDMTKRLRSTPSLIPVIDRSLHEEIHRETPAVPVMGHYAMRHVVNLFHPTGSTLRDMDIMMFSIESATLDQRTHPIDRQIGALAIQAIELQRDMLRDNGYRD